MLTRVREPSLAWAMREEIRKLTEQPIVKVIVTHYHADHIYGLQVFADEGAEIIAPRGAYEYLEAPSAATRLDERLPVPVEDASLQASAPGVAPGEQAVARGRTHGRRRVRVGEAPAFAGEPVEVRLFLSGDGIAHAEARIRGETHDTRRLSDDEAVAAPDALDQTTFGSSGSGVANPLSPPPTSCNMPRGMPPPISGCSANDRTIFACFARTGACHASSCPFAMNRMSGSTRRIASTYCP